MCEISQITAFHPVLWNEAGTTQTFIEKPNRLEELRGLPMLLRGALKKDDDPVLCSATLD